MTQSNIFDNRVPVSFFTLLLWVVEIHFLMQIIINRIAIIAESRKTIWRLKWGTALFISLINIAVFCIFIPAHMVPPPSQTLVQPISLQIHPEQPSNSFPQLC
ncbi:hypothetical protein IMZ48_47105 [Candidatus Bathyarchaeota archaeon]|nr:hypothetical protein [Candidatus Bathyarchaeota archaeon]